MGSGRFVAAEAVADFQVLLRQMSGAESASYITQQGKAVAVLLDIHRYNQLMDLIEESESLKAQQVGAETRQHITVRGILRRSTTTKLLRRRH